MSLSSKKYGVGILDLVSGKKPIPDPVYGSRVKKAPDPRTGSATLVAGVLIPGKLVADFCVWFDSFLPLSVINIFIGEYMFQ